jgi:hypothetical protein
MAISSPTAVLWAVWRRVHEHPPATRRDSLPVVTGPYGDPPQRVVEQQCHSLGRQLRGVQPTWARATTEGRRLDLVRALGPCSQRPRMNCHSDSAPKMWCGSGPKQSDTATPPNWSGPSGLLRCPAHGSRAFAQLKATDIRTDPDAGQVMRMIDKTEASTLAFHK